MCRPLFSSKMVEQQRVRRCARGCLTPHKELEIVRLPWRLWATPPALPLQNFTHRNSSIKRATLTPFYSIYYARHFHFCICWKVSAALLVLAFFRFRNEVFWLCDSLILLLFCLFFTLLIMMCRSYVSSAISWRARGIFRLILLGMKVSFILMPRLAFVCTGFSMGMNTEPKDNSLRRFWNQNLNLIAPRLHGSSNAVVACAIQHCHFIEIIITINREFTNVQHMKYFLWNSAPVSDGCTSKFWVIFRNVTVSGVAVTAVPAVSDALPDGGHVEDFAFLQNWLTVG